MNIDGRDKDRENFFFFEYCNNSNYPLLAFVSEFRNVFYVYLSNSLELKTRCAWKNQVHFCDINNIAQSLKVILFSMSKSEPSSTSPQKC